MLVAGSEVTWRAAVAPPNSTTDMDSLNPPELNSAMARIWDTHTHTHTHIHTHTAQTPSLSLHSLAFFFHTLSSPPLLINSVLSPPLLFSPAPSPSLIFFPLSISGLFS